MILLIGLPFLKGAYRGWLDYYSRSTSAPRFTEEQIRLADEGAATLNDCHPIHELIDTTTHAS